MAAATPLTVGELDKYVTAESREDIRGRTDRGSSGA